MKTIPYQPLLLRLLHGLSALLMIAALITGFLVYDSWDGRFGGLQLTVRNTTMLLAAAIAVGSGKLQDENWLSNGELNHAAYFAHLIAWILVVLGIAIHILMSAKVGGIPLLISMVDRTIRADDWLVKKVQRLTARKR